MSQKQIIIAPNGFVFIGQVTADNAGNLSITEASVIRIWGTTSGLGEIAINGPTKNTIFDFCGDLYIPKEAAPLRITCKV